MANSANIKQQIIESLKSKIEQTPLLEQFVSSFYSYIPFDYTSNYQILELAYIAKSSYELFVNRTPNQPQIYVHNETQADDIGYTIIQIINDDMPFLVDSISEFLQKKKLHIKQIINALLKVKRDDKGKLLTIEPIQKNHPNESVIYIKLDLIQDSALYNRLATELTHILSEVRLATADWSLMLEEATKTESWFPKNNDENQKFAQWLRQGNFTFTGFRQYVIENKNASSNKSTDLGIFKLNGSELREDIKEDIFIPNHYFARTKDNTIIGKIKTVSKVHKSTNLDYVCFVNYENKQKIVVNIFIGMFASKIDYQSVTTIPIIQTKAMTVLDRAEFVEDSFLGKELFSILETFPRDELLQISSDNLFQTTMEVLSCLNNPRLLVFTRATDCKNFLNLMVFLPKTRITSDIIEKVKNVIKAEIPGKFINQTLKISTMALAYTYISLKVKDNAQIHIDVEQLENKLDAATSLWNEHLGIYLEKKFGKQNVSPMLAVYNKSFPSGYQTRFTLEDATNDIEYIEKIDAAHSVFFNLYQQQHTHKNKFNLKIYSLGDKTELFKIMPIIENLGFHTLEENNYVLDVAKFGKPVHIQDFSLEINTQETYLLENIKANIEEAIEVIFTNKFKNDPINKLMLSAGLNWRQVFLLCAYSKYIIQMKFLYSQEYIRFVLAKHAKLAKYFVELFYAKFNIANSEKIDQNKLMESLRKEMDKILDNAEDRVVRTMLDIITHTIRTNYFQPDENGNVKDYVSLKLNSAEISNLPKPVPFVEIFVYSARMEGIHLRGGKVARGGIRWSDRSEDYRTEVLGLMKAQMSKNAIIVPVGSKGGFYVKQASRYTTREEIQNEGIECYKTLLRGMLDITDNIVDGKIVRPQNVICYDEEDPYLVVAADKGTATFSDIANQVSLDYNFWLGDAFASGGSAGYDHKKMGITARGAWISAIEHFKSLDMHPEKDAFTAVGIGDMSGDVFGNGLLQSRNYKLIAAFNHIHIFIDPNPDPEKSFNERKRLFELPRSNWTDYDPKLISTGGAVFERSAKSIKLTPQIKSVLDIAEDNIDPDSLIKKILTANVDLMWNGGIGTYVKAENESNEEIGNKGNDSVRVNGKDLRCKIVAEGGNLGFTQLSRIEYEFNGGKINTDALDNSAGVDCSDHEVNIKIALSPALESKNLTREARNKLLAGMTDNVAELVLYDNIIQNQSVSVSSTHKVKMFESYVRLLRTLETEGILDRKVEFLPNDAAIAERIKNGLGFTRPELAVLMSYSKNAIYKDLLQSKLPDDAYFEKYLVDYFPTEMQKKFLPEILAHRLRREIIVTVISNKLVNHLGSYFFHVAQEYTGLNGCDIARAFCIVWEIFDLEKIWKAIESIETPIKTELFGKVQTFAQSAIYWFLRNKSHLLNVEKILKEFGEHVKVLSATIANKITGEVKIRVQEKCEYFCKNDVPKDLAQSLANLNVLYSAMDITLVATKYIAKLENVAAIYFAIGERFNLDWLKYTADQLPANTYWQRMLVYTIKDDIYDNQRRLTAQIVKNDNKTMEDWIKDNHKKVVIFDQFLEAVKAMPNIDADKLVVTTKQIERLT